MKRRDGCDTNGRHPADVQRQRDLERTLASEILGELVFAAAARWTRAPARRAKWLRLRELETQTKRRLVEFLAAHDERADPPRLPRLTGWALGTGLALLPWAVAMRALERGTRSYLATFERLQRSASASELGFLSYVVAHEQAIAEFARRELGGRPETSLQPVERLLAEPLRPGATGGPPVVG